MQDLWWDNSVVYQIYPKSFKDTNHDGIGDIRGIIDSLDYIQSIGVNTLWLNPIFISPQIDNGYDVSNYYAIDPIFGSLDDVEELIEEAHKRNIKILFDLVLNHTSSQHPWFKEAIKGPDNLYRDYYLFEPAKDDGSAPNNWGSFFGGSVWEKDPKYEEYYFHLFDKEMPDLNWKNREVRRAMLDIALFWLDKGIDGFRLDAFIHMAKADFSLNVANIPEGEISLAEPYYANLPEVVTYLSEFISELKKVKPDLLVIGEAASATPELAKTYIGDDLCQTVISFDHFPERRVEVNELVPEELLHRQLDFRAFKHKMIDWQTTLDEDELPSLYWNNHDMPRVVSRFGNDTTYRKESSKSLACAMYLLRGIPVILYGEEIGMKNLRIDNIETFSEPKAMGYYVQLLENGISREEALERLTNINKEASRGSMQWSGQENGGFSTTTPWMGVNVETEFSVETESADDSSVLAFYQELLSLKKTPLFTKGTVTFVESHDDTISYYREYKDQEAFIICNLTDNRIELDQTFSDDSNWNQILGSQENWNGKELAPYDYYCFVK